MKADKPKGDNTEPSEIILYPTPEGAKLQLRLVGESVFMTQGQMAELFGVSVQNISLHLKNIFADEKSQEGAVVSRPCPTPGHSRRRR